MKKAWISLLALVLAIAYPFTALAATWDNVNTAEKLKEAFADTDAAGVIINLSGDIDLYRALEALEGQTYVINGTTYVLANVSLKGGGKGGSVTINGDVVGKEDNEALRVDDEVHVTVNGNVDASASDNYNGVDAQGNAQVTVNGDVKGCYEGIEADDNAQVTVNGNVSTKNDDAVEAKDNSQVTVTGDVTSEQGGGINARNNAEVTVGGSVRAGEEGIDARGDAKVTVAGDVVGGSGDPDEVDMDDPSGYSDGYDAVQAEDNAQVSVGGNATGGDGYGNYGYGGNGVQADDSAQVTVGGDAVGGNVTANPEVSGEQTKAGHGVAMDSTANVTVGGDAVGGRTNGADGKGGNGAYIRLIFKEVQDGRDIDIASLRDANGEEEEDTLANGSLTVGGVIRGGKNGDSTDAAALYYKLPNEVLEQDPAPKLTLDDFAEDLAQGRPIFSIFEELTARIYARTRSEAQRDAMADPLLQALGIASAEELYALSQQEAMDKINALSPEAQQALLEKIVAEYNAQREIYANKPIIERYLAMRAKEAFMLLSLNYFKMSGATNDDFWAPLAKAMGFASVQELYQTNYEKTMEDFEKLPEATRREVLQATIDLVGEASENGPLAGVYVTQVTTWKLEPGKTHADSVASNADDLLTGILAQMTLYTVRVRESAQGTITTSIKEAQAGQKVTVTATPAAGFALKRILLNGVALVPEDGVYSFLMPENGGVELSAEYESTARTDEVPVTGEGAALYAYAALALLCAAGVLCLLSKKRAEQR